MTFVSLITKWLANGHVDRVMKAMLSSNMYDSVVTEPKAIHVNDEAMTKRERSTCVEIYDVMSV